MISIIIIITEIMKCWSELNQGSVILIIYYKRINNKNIIFKQSNLRLTDHKKAAQIAAFIF
jgi:hypothetical protein